MKRAERHAQVVALKESGMTFNQIAAHLGIARSTATSAYYDPTGDQERARKASYSRPCIDCGTPLNGSWGNSPRAPKRCAACAAPLAAETRRVWTADNVVERIREWADRYGDAPAMADWSPHIARHQLHDEDRARRCEDAIGCWPSPDSVIRIFGSWNAGLEAAGFTPRAPHGGGGNQFLRRAVRERSAA